MNKLLFLASCLATLASSRFLQQTNSTSPSLTIAAPGQPNITYASTLKCGECLLGGFIFCGKIKDNSTVSSDLAQTDRFCCKDLASCSSYTSNTQYNCSKNYTDKAYAQMFCPFNTNSCGGQKDITFNKEGESKNITINNLA